MSSSSESEDATPMKRKNYDMHFKLEFVAYAEKYNLSKAANDKKFPRSCVKDWTNQKVQLEAQLKASLLCSISSSKRLQDADAFWRTRISTRSSSTGFVSNVRRSSVSAAR